jgi:hypothetical protein
MLADPGLGRAGDAEQEQRAIGGGPTYFGVITVPPARVPPSR